MSVPTKKVSVVPISGNASGRADAALSSVGMTRLADPTLAGRFQRDGYVALEHLLDPAFCRATVEKLKFAPFMESSDCDIQGDNRFRMLTGDQLFALLPSISGVYDQFAPVLTAMTGRTYVPLENRKYGITLNYMTAGCRFAPHFDGSEITVSLYLSSSLGGDLEIWPKVAGPVLQNLGRFHMGLATKLALSLSRKPPIAIPAREGTVVMFSSNTVHRVTPLTEATPVRVSIIMLYDRPQFATRGRNAAVYAKDD